MDAILHGIGICADNHSHLDLLDLVIGGAAGAGTYGTLRYYGTGIKLYVKSIIYKK